MKTKRKSRMIALLLVLCLCVTMLPGTVIAQEAEAPIAERELTRQDVLAGIADFSDLYDPLDPNTVPDIIGYEEALEKNHIKRSYEDEGNELNKVVFENLDGTRTMYLFDFPVKYVDTNGEVQDISLEIAEGSSGAFETAGNSTVTTFSAQASGGISLSGNGTNITLIPIMPTVSTGTQTMTAGSTAGSVGNISAEETVISHAATRIDKKTIQYRYDSKTTIEYSLTYTGFKEDIVVSEYTGQTEYAFTLRTGGYALEEMDGSYFLVDGAGNIKATIGDIIIFTADERNNTMGSIIPTTIVENEEYLLTIMVDPEFLADPKTAYPIRIDPTVEINYDNNGAGAIQDATVYTDDTTNGSLGSIFVGLKQNGGIARILMKFPGLNLSSLGSTAVIESATVTLRDLLCESTELNVYCYVYAGATWDESTVCWDNTIAVSPNYLSDYLDVRTVSYSIGTALSDQHRYSFDITDAVQGWKDGNYSQEKGIVFKAYSTVENGSTYNWKTMGSYNRASYKPTLSVTYADNEDQFLQNTTYYINNKGTGKYLRYNSGSVSGQSGLLSALGNSIQWEMQGVADGYVIRAKNDTTKYLAVPADKSSTSVEIVTVSQSAIPDRCVWREVPSSGGYQIRSAYNLKLLYSSGSGMYTSATVPSSSSANYLSYFWRIVTTSQYGNTSSNTLRELSGFSVAELILNAGESKSPMVTKTPSNAAWADASDFTYTGYDVSSVTYDATDNKFSVNSYFEPGHSSSVLAVHKVTGQWFLFTLTVLRKAVLVGIPDTLRDHDHTSSLNSIRANINDFQCYGYNDVILHSGEISVAALNAYLDAPSNNLFISRSHGDFYPEAGTQAGTYIRLNDIALDETDSDIVKYSSTGPIASLDLSNMQLMMFVGCYTGKGGENGLNLPAVAVSRGARTAIGFEDSINCEGANKWLTDVFYLIDDGYTVGNACFEVSTENEFWLTSLADYVICGDESLVLYPYNDLE